MEKPQILYLADDDEDERQFLREAIEAMNQDIKIIEAVNGRNLLDLLGIQNLDAFRIAILLDLNMPVINGMEALTAIRNNQHTRHIPTAMISTCTDPLIIKQIYDAGINIFIKKPTSSDGFKKVAVGIQVCFFN